MPPVPKNLLALLAGLGVLLLFGCADRKAPGTADATISAMPAAPLSRPAAVTSRPAASPIALSPADTAENAADRLPPPSGDVFRGSGQFVRRGDASPVPATAKRAAAASVAGDDITLNFVNAGIGDVAKAVLGDLLKLNYVVSPSVQGTVTLQTSQPIDRTMVLPALQTAFRFAGVTIVDVHGSYRVVPIAEAPRQGEPMRRRTMLKAAQSPGFGVEIVPLRYVGAEEMQRLLDPVAPQGGILRVDQARNLLILGGTEQELAAMLDQIATFDVDWLSGMSFALLPLKYAEVQSVADELGEILGGEGGPIGSLVRVVPIERMNAILLISSQATYLDQLKTWVHRLDRGNDKEDVRLYVYSVQNGRAADLAGVLRRVFGRAGGAGGGDIGVPNTSSPSDFLGGPFQNGGVGSVGGGTMAAAGSFGGGNGLSSGGSRFGGGLSNGGSGLGGLRRQAGGTGLANGLVAGSRTPGAVAADADTGSPLDMATGGNGPAGPRITADDTNNALLILATARDYQVIEAALKRLDVLPMQVLIEASIVEVTLTNDLRYGVQYFLRKGNFSFLRTATAALPPRVPVPGFAFLFSAGVDNQVILNLLEDVTSVNVVSAPQMMVLNNQTATLQVGDQVPIATQSAVSVITPGAPIVNTIQFRDTGVILQVTPRVNESGLVLLDIGQEVSDVARTTSSTLDSPTIQQRRFTSSVAIRDGETVALGGLIRDNRSNGRSGIPILHDIPYVGALFGDTSSSTTRTELIVLLTPHVLRTEQDARGITEELRRRMHGLMPIEMRAR